LQPKTLSPFIDERGIPLHLESEKVQASGLIVSEHCEQPSHHACAATLSAWLQKNDVPAISGIDTRALTKRLREHGVMRGKIIVAGAAETTAGNLAENQVAAVSCQSPVVYNAAKSGAGKKAVKIALVDCGAKANILRCLLKYNVVLTRVPWDYDLGGLDYDGLFLSNGPGDPKACVKTIAQVRRAFVRGKPVFGICLGNQIMALAAGADTYKLPYGHRSQNQPCVEAGTGRCYITSQNHGYAVRAESLPSGWEPWFTNANDGTIEGIRSTDGPFSAVQFHPEGCPGPRDTEYLIERFVANTYSRRDSL
jgi:carbamoyl-phosphate synthase small subunit